MTFLWSFGCIAMFTFTKKTGVNRSIAVDIIEVIVVLLKGYES